MNASGKVSISPTSADLSVPASPPGRAWSSSVGTDRAVESKCALDTLQAQIIFDTPVQRQMEHRMLNAVSVFTANSKASKNQ